MRIKGVKIIPSSEVRQKLIEVLHETKEGPVAITKHGKVVGYIVSEEFFNSQCENG